MGKISGLKAGKSREKRVNVFLDGKFALGMLAEVALKEKLKVGQELSESRLESLAVLDRYQRCLNAAIRYLGYRPRSEAEIRQHLHRHGFDSDGTEKALTRLKEQGLVDDTAFARFWIDNREAFSPRSRRLTKLELKRKGLDSDIIEQVVGEVDDSDSAYRAALSRVRRLPKADYQDFRRRLGQYLGRRGFSYDVINSTIEKVWREISETSKITRQEEVNSFQFTVNSPLNPDTEN
jgi:regulatory protein